MTEERDEAPARSSRSRRHRSLQGRGRIWFLVAFGLLSVFLATKITKLSRDPSPFASLPDPRMEAALFEQLRLRFGLHRVMALGVRPAEDALSAAGLQTLQQVEASVLATPGVARVQGLTSTPRLRPDDMGFVAEDLIPPGPWDPEEIEEIRLRVLDEPLVVGNLVSADGRAAMLAVTLVEGSEESIRETARRVADRAQRLAEASGLDVQGEPWVLAQSERLGYEDGRRMATGLGALLVVLGGGLAIARGMRPAFLFGAGTGAVLLWGVGGRGVMQRAMSDVELLFVPSLFVMALPFGVALALRDREVDSRVELLPALVVWVAAFNLARIPGPEYSKNRLAVGAALTGMSLVVLARAGLAPQSESAGGRRRLLAIALILVVAIGIGSLVGWADARTLPPLPTDGPQVLQESFDRGEVFFVWVRGDLRNPLVMRRLAAVEDGVRRVPGVSQVVSAAGIVRHLGGFLGDGRRIPGHEGKLANILFFIEGTPDVATMLDDDLQEALVIVSASPRADVAGVRDAMEAVVADVARPLRVQVRHEGDGLQPELQDRAAREIADWLRRPLAEVTTILDDPLQASEIVSSLEAETGPMIETVAALGVDEETAQGAVARMVEGMGAPDWDGWGRQLKAEMGDDGFAAEVLQVLKTEAEARIRRIRAESSVRRLGIEGSRNRDWALAKLLALDDPLVEALPDASDVPRVPLHVKLTGPGVFQLDVARELRKITSFEGGLALLVLLVACVLAGRVGPLAPALVYLGWRSFVEGPTLVDAPLIPMVVVGGVALLLGTRASGGAGGAVASGLILTVLLLVLSTLELPAMRELTTGLILLSTGSMLGYLAQSKRL